MLVSEDVNARGYASLLKALKVPEELNYPFLEKVFLLTMQAYREMRQGGMGQFGVNVGTLSLYLVSEHAFYLQTHPDIDRKNLYEGEEYRSFLASVSLDKYFTNEKLAFRMGSLTSKYSPLMSTLDLYLNFILGMLSRYKRNDPSQTLIVDVMNKGFQMAKCVASLLENGFETEAFSTWRTLHENECILQCLIKYGAKVIDGYLRHMRYALAFRGGVKSKEETDAIFVEIKDKMKAKGLKSKDMKRFIEYGWLYAIDNVDGVENFKLNFRDGVQRMAGLSAYSKVYEMSSEIAHSSPLLIYSKKDYFFSLTLLSLYESFFRLEKIFASLYMSSVTEPEKERYLQLRKVYHGQLNDAYQFQKTQIASLSKGKDESN